MMQEDSVLWNDKSGYFISDVYKHLQSDSTLQLDPWFRRLWKSGSKPSENLMLWKLLNNALLTQDKLLCMNIIQANICRLCNRGNETCNHLYFGCSYTFIVWTRILYTLQLHKPNRDPVLEWRFIYKATRWKTAASRLLLRIFKKVILACWHERNRRTFTGQKLTVAELMYKILVT